VGHLDRNIVKIVVVEEIRRWLLREFRRRLGGVGH